MYVDMAKCGRSLGEYRNSSGKQLNNSSIFWESFINAPFTKAFRLKLEMNVTSKQMTDGLSENLTPALQAECRSDTKAERILELLYSHMANPMPKGVEVIMVCTRDAYHLCIGDKWQTVMSPELSKALQRIYVGSRPVTKGAKQSWADGLGAVIERGLKIPDTPPASPKLVKSEISQAASAKNKAVAKVNEALARQAQAEESREEEKNPAPPRACGCCTRGSSSTSSTEYKQTTICPQEQDSRPCAISRCTGWQGRSTSPPQEAANSSPSPSNPRIGTSPCECITATFAY